VKITRFYEIETENSVATGEEIATLVVNMQRGLVLKELKAIEGKIYFIFKDKEEWPFVAGLGDKGGPLCPK